MRFEHRRQIFSPTLAVAFACLAAAQSHSAPGQPVSSSSRSLVPTEKVAAKSEFTSLLYDSLKCDADGNIYYFSDVTGSATLRKINTKGERVAEFRPEANPDMPVDLAQDFVVDPDGRVMILVFPHEIARYVFEYQPDGSYRSATKLDAGFPWVPTTIAAFPSGGLLVSGLECSKGEHDSPVQVPFTGIFTANGKLLKELKLEDDEDLLAKAQSGDPRFLSASGNNRAVEFSKMQAGEDGNIYLMRWTSPAIIYVISPGGEVVRRFTVDPESAAYRPITMHTSAGRIAILFADNATGRDVIKVVDTEGHPVATYAEPAAKSGSAQPLGEAFVCYRNNPERFTFLTFGASNQLEIQTVQPR